MKTQSKRSVVVLFAALVIGAALSAALAGPSRPAGAQSSPPGASDLPRTITVVGEGTVALEPDVAQAQIGVDVADDTAKQASAEAAKIMEAVLAALKAQGIATKDIQTSNYSIYADRPADPLTGRPGEQVTYRVNNGVSVTIRDLAKIGAVLDAVIDAGANNIYGVTFSVSDPDKVMAEARRKAVEDARARAEELAALHGVALGQVVSVSEVIGGSMPVPIRESVNAVMGMGGGGGNAIQPGEMKMTTQLQAVYAIAGPAGTAMTTTGQPPVAPTMAPAEGGSGPTVAAAEASPTVASSQQAGSSQPQPAAMATPAQQVTTMLIEQFVASPPGAAAKQGKVTITGDDKLLRPFVERWLAPASSDFQQAKAALRLGQLPEDLPFDLPVPADATLISSLTQGDPPYSEILLTTRQSAAEVLDFYREKLIALGMVTPPADPNMPILLASPERTACSWPTATVAPWPRWSRHSRTSAG